MHLVTITGDSPLQKFQNIQVRLHVGDRVRDYIGKTVSKKQRKIKQLWVGDGCCEQ
jgi:hypothetical protein